MPTILAAIFGPMLRIAPEARYFSMPSADAGWVVLSSSALNCWPCSRSTTHLPVASRCSPAETEVVLPTTVTKSVRPLTMHLENSKTVLGVVVGDSLDEAVEGFGHGGCRQSKSFSRADKGSVYDVVGFSLNMLDPARPESFSCQSQNKIADPSTAV